MSRSSLLLAAVAGLSVLSLGCANAQAPAPKPAAKADPGTKPPCTDKSRACLERIARLYIDALVTHDGTPLPLAPTVRRSENALTNARGPYEVRESFARTHMVEGVRDVRLYTDAEKGEVVAFFRADIDLKEKDADATTRAGDTDYKVSVTVPAGTYTVHEAERFKIVDGYITEIEIVAHVEKGKGGGSGWPVERDAAVSAVPK
jgi:hypothetical protein